MNNEISSLIKELETTLDGQPWFGRSVYSLLNDVDTSIVFTRPSASSHSAMDLLYHMITWADFTLKRLEKQPITDMEAFDKLDWREIDPAIHNWDEGIGELVATHQQIIAQLQNRQDSLLDEKVDYRDYDFRYLLKGLIQHNIYHVGQVALLQKTLSTR